MMKKISSLVVVLALAMALALPAIVSAQEDVDDVFGVNTIGDEIILGSKDIRATVGSIINAGLGFLGVVAVVIILMGGFKYMTSGGDEGKTKKARDYIIAGIIGLAIILSAYAVTSFVMSRLLTATK
jgi:hypothetical protein